MIEHAAIVSTSSIIYIEHLLEIHSYQNLSSGADSLISMKEVEIAHIIKVLVATHGTIAGEQGAAKILGLHPNTLRSRMEKLNIQKYGIS